MLINRTKDKKLLLDFFSSKLFFLVNNSIPIGIMLAAIKVRQMKKKGKNVVSSNLINLVLDSA
jgi:hypothetical protein